MPDNTTWYSDSAIPGLPAKAGCPDALEAVLRGLLQSRPEDRLPPEEAVRALHASLYGPVGDEEAVKALLASAYGPEDASTPAKTLGGALIDSEWMALQRDALRHAEAAAIPLPMQSLVEPYDAELTGDDEESSSSEAAIARIAGDDAACAAMLRFAISNDV